MAPGNGYDEARLVPYKYDLRRVSARLYERSSVTGAAAYRDSFVVRDAAGNYWCYYRVSATNPAEIYDRPRSVTHDLRSNKHFQIIEIQNGPRVCWVCLLRAHCRSCHVSRANYVT